MKPKFPQFPLVHSPFRSFFILLIIAVAAGLGAVQVEKHFAPQASNQALPHHVVKENAAKTETLPAIDISNWKKFTDSTYSLSFMYPPDWSVKTYPSQAGYYIIVL